MFFAINVINKFVEYFNPFFLRRQFNTVKKFNWVQYNKEGVTKLEITFINILFFRLNLECIHAK